VNEAIEKQIDPAFPKDLILYEYNLPIYYKNLQETNFCESSVYIHMFLNWDLLVEPYDFIGCLQYDMSLNEEMITCMNLHINEITADTTKLLFYFECDNAVEHLSNSMVNLATNLEECITMNGWDEILEMYNKYYNTKFERKHIIYSTIPLFHTFSMHKSIFKRITPFFIEASGKIYNLLKRNRLHFPYHLERLWGVLLYLQRLEGYLTDWVKLPLIKHSNTLKDMTWKPL